MSDNLSKLAVVVPNWDGVDHLADCLDSLLSQSLKARVIVVDNGSTDGSLKLLAKYPDVEIIRHDKNLGFTGGVNAGFRLAMDMGFRYVATLNNDAVVDKNWLRYQLDNDYDDGTYLISGAVASKDRSTIYARVETAHSFRSVGRNVTAKAPYYPKYDIEVKP